MSDLVVPVRTGMLPRTIIILYKDNDVILRIKTSNIIGDLYTVAFMSCHELSQSVDNSDGTTVHGYSCNVVSSNGYINVNMVYDSVSSAMLSDVRNLIYEELKKL